MGKGVKGKFPNKINLYKYKINKQNTLLTKKDLDLRLDVTNLNYRATDENGT